jgi:hypothetical protein
MAATPLIIAAVIGNLEIDEMLIEAKADIPAEESWEHRFALAHAADACRFELMCPSGAPARAWTRVNGSVSLP